MSPVPYPPPPYQPPPRRPGSITAVAIISVLIGILCGCGSISNIFMPAMMQMQKNMIDGMQVQMKHDFESQRQRNIERLQREKDAATTPAEQQRVDDELRRAESQPMPDMQKLTSMMTLPGNRTFYVVSGILGAVISLLFLVSGIGLFPMMEWARKLNITTSVLDILFTLASTSYNVAVVGPEMGRHMQEMMDEIQKASPPGTSAPPMPEMGTIMQTMMGVFMSIGGFIIIVWLVAAICMLSTRRVREAFRARAVPR
jgi:hypothetical protein